MEDVSKKSIRIGLSSSVLHSRFVKAQSVNNFKMSSTLSCNVRSRTDWETFFLLCLCIVFHWEWWVVASSLLEFYWQIFTNRWRWFSLRFSEKFCKVRRTGYKIKARARMETWDLSLNNFRHPIEDSILSLSSTFQDAFRFSVLFLIAIFAARAALFPISQFIGWEYLFDQMRFIIKCSNDVERIWFWINWGSSFIKSHIQIHWMFLVFLF